VKKDYLWIGLTALLIPILVRALWFYPGVPARPEIATPDYQSLTVPQPPLETPEAEAKVKTPGGAVLVDAFHGNQFQPGEIQSLKEAVEDREGRIETVLDLASLENGLKYASACVVISPSVPFSAAEISLFQSFVEGGGRLVVFTDATRGILNFDFFTGATTLSPDVNAANPLLAPFGITVNSDYLYNVQHNEGNFRNVFFDEFGKNELTFGLKQVAFYGTHSVKSDSGTILLLGGEQTLSSITDAHDPASGGAALSEDGNVIAFGDLTFLTPPYNNVADNATLIANIADFMLGGKRTTTLANFPYIFSQHTLQVLPTSEVQMTAEMIAALGRLQASLEGANLSMQIATGEPEDGDLLVLGTFTPTDDLLPYIEPFDLLMDEFTEYVEVPGFGNVGRTGNGILIFDAGKQGNTLILLADTVDDLTFLLDTVSSGSLYGCVLQGDIGVCSIGFGGSFSEDTGESAATEEPVEGEAAPEAIPTPGG
jgi:hypothetical protein